MHPQQNWTANWINCANADPNQYGIYHLRKKFNLRSTYKNYIVHISADNRYKLFVNGIPVCSGPIRSDHENWWYDNLDIAPYLLKGDNIVAAQVWNMGQYASGTQISIQTAFLLQGSGSKILDTDTSWKIIKSVAYTACSINNRERLAAYMVIDPGDEVDGNKFLWNWEKINYDDSKWDNAQIIYVGSSVGHSDAGQWKLKPRNIPIFREENIHFKEIRSAEGIKESQWFNENSGKLNPIYIPAFSTVRILFDQTFHIVAYPELYLSKGKHAKIQLTYAESLFDEYGNKNNRDEVDGKYLIGNYDIFISDGGENRMFRPLSIRAYRYVQLEIWTKDYPLIINDLFGVRTGYPMKLNAEFNSNDESIKHIWSVSWRTLMNCTGEGFYDTPYYEQLQYTADSRIQALAMLYTSGDDRLMRKCIMDFYNSRTTDGLTQSRYPSKKFQVIPAFSLFWISMIYDYWMYRKDDDFIQQFLPRINKILSWFELHMDQQKKMLGPLPYWNFVDWDNFNSWGTAPGTEEGSSSIISLHLAYTLDQAIELFTAFNESKKAMYYKKMTRDLKRNTYLHCFDEEKGLLADTPKKNSYSQHANIWAILSDAVKGTSAQILICNLLIDNSIGRVTYFYRFYLNQALKKAKMADLYYSLLTPWREMLKLGLTTFAEKPEPTRSDCHGWSASPSYDFLATILGIMPGSPGFATVIIQPALGELTKASGRIPHPQGFISVSFKRKKENRLLSSITLPENLTGTLIWKGKKIQLTPGKQHYEC